MTYYFRSISKIIEFGVSKIKVETIVVIISQLFISSASSAETSCDSLYQYSTIDAYYKCKLKIVDKRLNDEYRQIIKSSEPENEKLLREAQREWLKYRDKNCTHIGSYKKDFNSKAKHIEAECLIHMTNSRASQLQAMSKTLDLLWRKIGTDREWLIWSDDSKKGVDGRVYPAKQIPQHEITEHYIENVMELHGDLEWQIKKEKIPFTAKPTVTFIGKWNNYNVYDVIVNEHEIQLKQIVLEVTPVNFKILYSLFPWPTKLDLTPSYIINTDGVDVLVSKVRVPGTGSLFYEKYFIIDPDTGLPDVLDMSLIEETLKELLPPKHGIWKGGSFSLRNLSYVSPVWKDGDGNCCPSGGRVEIKLIMNNYGKLIPISKEYDPDYNNMR